MQVGTSVLSLAVYLLLTYTVFRGDLRIYQMQMLYVLSALFDVSWFFFGTEQFKVTTLRSLLTRGLVIVSVFAFVHSQQDLWIYTLILSLSFLVEQLILFVLIFRQVRFVPIRWQDIRPHIRPNLRLFLPLAVMSIYNWMDKLMVGFLAGNEQVAFYNYADSIINLPKGILLTLGTVMLPRVSRMAVKQQQEQAITILKQTTEFTCFLCCLLCFGIAAVAPVFIPLFLGPGYETTIYLTMSLALVMIPLSLTDTVQNQYLVPFHQERVYTVSVMLGAAINLLLNSLFIPVWGSGGAVLGTIGAALGAYLYQMFCIRQLFPLKELLRRLLPFMLCGGVEFAAAYGLRNVSQSPLLTLLVQVLAGGGAYLVCSALVIGLWRRELWQFIKGNIGV